MRKYALNEDVFETLNNESSYWLGYLAADGFISDKPRQVQVRLKLSKKDLSTLEMFSDFCESGKPIYWDEGYPCVIISSRKIVTDVKKFLPAKNKSSTLTLPDIDKQFLSHFLRGYFDGDGWASFLAPRTLSIGICGLGPIINTISDLFLKEGIVCSVRKDKRSNAKTVYFSSFNSISRFYDLLDGSNPLRLDRKWENVEKYLDMNIRRKV